MKKMRCNKLSMKKPTVTLESLEQRVETLILNLDKKFDRRFDLLEKQVEDNTFSIQFLIGNAVMRDEMNKAMDDRLIPMEERITSMMDKIIKSNETRDQEFSILRYHHNALDHRVIKIEKKFGLPSPI